MEFYKGKEAEKLLTSLSLQPRGGALMIAKALKSGLNMFTESERKTVRVTALGADQGPVFKRWRAGSRGMAKKYSKKTAHLHITLTVPSKTEKA